MNDARLHSLTAGALLRCLGQCVRQPRRGGFERIREFCAAGLGLNHFALELRKLAFESFSVLVGLAPLVLGRLQLAAQRFEIAEQRAILADHPDQLSVVSFERAGDGEEPAARFADGPGQLPIGFLAAGDLGLALPDGVVQGEIGDA